MANSETNKLSKPSIKRSLVEIQAEKYAQFSLPYPDQSIISKYFTESAHQEYHQTYKKLLHQADLLSGGKKELLATVIASQDPSQAVKNADDKLLKWGVVTPDIWSTSAAPAAKKFIPRPKTSSSSTPSLAPIQNHRNRPTTAPNKPETTSLFNRNRPQSVGASRSKPIPNRIPKTSTIFDSSPFDFESECIVDDHQLSSEGEWEAKEFAADSNIPNGILNMPQLIIPQKNNFFASLDDESDEFTAQGNENSQASPRSVFLAGCLRYGLPPRSIAMLRKRISPILNLAHMSLGNQTAILLAEALDKMPYLQAINLTDNNLDDVGLSAIIRSIAKHSTLEVLDISQNIMDDDASKALAAYIGNDKCQLKCLRMSNTDIDDKECARFVDVLMNNRQLKELDMSNNFLGKDENLNVVMPDFLTGGESLAKLLRSSLCPLETLNLHWNMIRLEGASTLCDSIRHNSYLTHLDLSYNALGSAAVCVLGVALTENNKLKHLNLASNSIDSVATITLAIGMRENRSLREVILNGNSIGEQGARALMKIVLQEGQRLSIQTQDCDITARSLSSKLKIDNPIGDYLLNLSEPYERAIAFELFDIVANETNVDITVCDLYLSANNNFSDNVSLSGGSIATKKSTSTTSDSKKKNTTGKKQNGTIDNAAYVDPFLSCMDKLGPLTASYDIVRFDEEKPYHTLQPSELAEERFFQALVPIATLPRLEIVKIVKRFDSNCASCFPVSSLKCIFDELLGNKRKINQQKHQKSQFQESFFMTSDGISLRGDTENNYDNYSLSAAAVSSLHENIDMLVHCLSRDAQKLLDPRQAGVIDNVTFIDYIIERARGAQDRLRQLRNIPRCAAILKSNSSSSSGMKRVSSATSAANMTLNDTYSPHVVDKSALVRYIPPVHGWLRLRLTERFLLQPSAPSSGASSNSTSYAMTRHQCLKLLDETMKMSKSNPMMLLLYAIDTTWLRLEEAQLLYSFAAKKADDPIMVLTRILLRMQSGSEARRLVHYCVGEDIMKLRRLKQRLGSVYYPLLNIYSGFYSLDLSNELDRMCLKRLMEKSVHDNNTRKGKGLWDTSQYGHWSCFRNEFHRSGVKGSTSSSITASSVSSGNTSKGNSSANNSNSNSATNGAIGIADVGQSTTNSSNNNNNINSNNGGNNTNSADTASGDFPGAANGGNLIGDGEDIVTASSNISMINSNLPGFSNILPENLISPAVFASQMPTRGRLEFDFVDIDRPDPKQCHAVHDDVIIDCLLLSRLLAEDEVNWALDQLNSMEKICRRNFLAENPTNAYRQDLGRAVHINDNLHTMYNQLSLRVPFRKKAFLREAIATMASSNNNVSNTTNNVGQSNNKSKPSQLRKSAAASAINNTNNNKRRQQKRKSSVSNVDETSNSRNSNAYGPSLVSDAEVTIAANDEDKDGSSPPLVDAETMRAVRDTVEALNLGDLIRTETGHIVANNAGAIARGRDKVTFNGAHENIHGTIYMNGIDQDIAKSALKGFRSFTKQGSRVQNKLRQWGPRMQEIIRDGRGSDEHKSAALLEFFELELSGYWLECRHVALVVDLMVSMGTAARSNMGSYRVELVVMLFDRIVDPWNMELLWQVLNAEEQAAILARIGFLNLFSPGKCSGGWSYDLSRWEERQCVKMHIDISFSEVNQQQWSFKIYNFLRGMAPVPAWALNRNWLTEESLPLRGLLTFEMSLGELPFAHNSPTDYQLRQTLGVLTLSGCRAYGEEIDVAVELAVERQRDQEYLAASVDYSDPLDQLLMSPNNNSLVIPKRQPSLKLQPLLSPSVVNNTEANSPTLPPLKSILKSSSKPSTFSSNSIIFNANRQKEVAISVMKKQVVIKPVTLDRLKTQRDILQLLCLPVSSSVREALLASMQPNDTSSNNHSTGNSLFVSRDDQESAPHSSSISLPRVGHISPSVPSSSVSSSPTPTNSRPVSSVGKKINNNTNSNNNNNISKVKRPGTASISSSNNLSGMVLSMSNSLSILNCQEHLSTELNAQWTYTMQPRPSVTDNIVPKK